MCLKLINEKLKRLNCFDYSVVKICVFTFTLLVVKFWPELVGLDWYWYALVFALSYGYLMARIFGR